VADTAHDGSIAETLNTEARADELPLAPRKQSSGRLMIVVSLSALLLVGAAAAAYAWPNVSIALPNLENFAELFPRAAAAAPMPDPAVKAALDDLQLVQQQNVAALHENADALQQNTALLKEDALKLESLRQSLAIQQTGLKGLSHQLSTLVDRVDALQNAMTPLTTASIAAPRARAKIVGVSRKKTVRLPKPFGPVSVGGAPLGPAPAQDQARDSARG
jgi:hypothetical protein